MEGFDICKITEAQVQSLRMAVECLIKVNYYLLNFNEFKWLFIPLNYKEIPQKVFALIFNSFQ